MDDASALSTPGSLKRAVRRGAAALARAQFASQLVSIASLAILLRLLTPHEYGLVGMVVPLLLFLRIFTTLGLQFTTVQRSELTDADVSAAFWIQLSSGVLVAMMALALAPLVGPFYGKPELAVELRNITAALAGTSVIAAVGAQPQALLERRLQMRTLGRIRVVAQLAGVTSAVAAAWNGAGVWALVVQQYVELSFLSVLCFAFSRWRPTWPPAWAHLLRNIHLGGWLAATTLVLFVADNLDRVLVGKLVTARDVGLYSQAYNVMIKPVYLVTTPLTALALASLSRAMRHPATAEQLAEAYHRVVAIALMPASLGLAVVGRQVMLTLGGETWREAGLLLAVLSLGMLAQSVVILDGYILMAAGRARACFLAAALLAIALAAGYVTGWWIGQVFHHPTLGIACGYSATILMSGLGPYHWFCLRAAGLRPSNAIRSWFPAALAAATMAIAVAVAGWIIPTGYQSLRLVLQIAVGIAVYALLARNELRWLASQLLGSRQDGRGI